MFCLPFCFIFCSLIFITGIANNFFQVVIFTIRRSFVFILEDALCVWTNLGKHSLFVWLFISSVKTGTRRIIGPDELSSVVRRSSRIVISIIVLDLFSVVFFLLFIGVIVHFIADFPISIKVNQVVLLQSEKKNYLELLILFHFLICLQLSLLLVECVFPENIHIANSGAKEVGERTK